VSNSELVRKAQRILETAESSEAMYYAAQTLDAVNREDETRAHESINTAQWMEA
jgi:hypothetical protein